MHRRVNDSMPNYWALQAMATDLLGNSKKELILRKKGEEPFIRIVASVSEKIT